MLRVLMSVAFALAVACAADEPAPVPCTFASGRPCAVGATCLGPAGSECNYATCAIEDGEPRLRATAITCAAAAIEPVPGGPFDCDPASIAAGSTTPPQGPCPLGGLWTIEDGFWGRCVPTSQCLPLPCDPAFADGCPSGHVCDAAAGTCRVAASDAASARPSVPRH